MKRIYHPYTSWEEYHAGMWAIIPREEEARLLPLAIELTGDAVLYGSWMLKVLDAWPISCEHNLTDTGMNRQAWIGHAAVTLALKCPEHITRRAWWNLTQRQQDEANAKADEAIRQWEDRQCQRNASAWMF